MLELQSIIIFQAPTSTSMAQNSETVRRGIGRPFQPGQSGNPGGVTKAAREAKRLAGEHAQEAITRLVEWMRSDDARASIQAALAILDRALGKPVAPRVDDEDGEDLSELSDEELKRIVLES